VSKKIAADQTTAAWALPDDVFPAASARAHRVEAFETEDAMPRSVDAADAPPVDVGLFSRRPVRIEGPLAQLADPHFTDLAQVAQ
jgi:hypothetical protein